MVISLSKQRTKSDDRDSNDDSVDFEIVGGPTRSGSRCSGNWATLNRSLSALNRGCGASGGRSSGGVVRCVKQNFVDGMDYTIRDKYVTGDNTSSRVGSGNEDTR